MAQGKMHSSPFHVESPQYKYAIEHETDDCIPTRQVVDCPHLSSSKKLCTLWNSGKQKCSSHNCVFYSSQLHRKASCMACAFCFEKKCFNSKRPQKSEFEMNNAEYCCYFLGEKDNQKQYYHIRLLCERFFYTQIADNCLKRIRSKNLIIGQCRAKLNGQRLACEEVRYLNKKINDKTAERVVAEQELLECNRHLFKIGGRLDTMP